MKLDVDIVEHIVKKNVTDSSELTNILKDLQQAKKEAEDDKKIQAAARGKKKLMAVQVENTEEVYIVQGKEEFDETTLIDVIRNKISSNFNDSKKGSKAPVTCLTEAFEFVTQKFWRDLDISLKTREPLPIIKTPNHKIILAVEDKKN